MSRVIIKNLPQKIKDTKLKSRFEEAGQVTDIRVIRTKDGFSRHFGYIGFIDSESAQKSVEQFNGTYLDGMKIQVEIAKSFNDPNLPRPWSKFSKGSSAYIKRTAKKSVKKSKSLTTVKKLAENTDSSKDDTKNPELDEFLSLFSKKSKKSTENAPLTLPDKRDPSMISDLDYIRSKVDKDIGNDVENTTYFTIKVIGLPFKSTKDDIRQFFSPILLQDDAIRIIKNKANRPTGRAFVDFKTRKEMYKALRRNGEYMQNRYIELFQDTESNESIQEPTHEEDITDKLMEHGRLFIRNLSYAVTESDVEKLFTQYGPLSETYLPIDPQTQTPIGFGFVTFMFSENACQALSELDATIFMGRILHILPAEPKPGIAEIENQKGGYKAKKEKELKTLSSNPYNWNALFLGSNAVAEAIAKKYGITKSKVLDLESPNSLAVRMALAETEIVNETKEFLQENGIDVECFNQSNTTVKRSKSIILVKNLPFNTTTDELDVLFSPFGTLGRIVLPKYGITGVVAFLSESQAKNAFTKLAYSKFKHLPLYLEWAPEKIFTCEKDFLSNTSENQIPVKTKQHTIYVKNINFSTKEESLQKLFEKYKPTETVVVRKNNPNSEKEKEPLSMGFGFVKFSDFASAKQAIIEKHGCVLDEHKLEISLAKQTIEKEKSAGKRSTETPSAPASSLLVIKNVPFEATKPEIHHIFSRFGSVKSIRMPKKVVSLEATSHRGFCFVEFFSEDDALLAFDTLRSSTHLYGRRLVIEFAKDGQDLENLRKKTRQQFVSERSVNASVKKTKIEFDF